MDFEEYESLTFLLAAAFGVQIVSMSLSCEAFAVILWAKLS